MKLSKTADFAVRIIVQLAEDRSSQTMHDLSAKLNVPYNNLSKIIQTLSNKENGL